MTTINLIQDFATPHNNLLIKELLKENIELNLWYSMYENKKLYKWKKNITNEHCISNIYTRKINFKFLFYCLKNRNEKYIIVGWMNINTILLHILFFVFFRKYNHWTDLPRKIEKYDFLAFIKRYFSYFLLRRSRCKVMVVGKTAFKFFQSNKFKKNKLVNIPVIVPLEKNLKSFKLNNSLRKEKYDLDNNQILISAGSRLVYNKGYDLLIKAVSLLRKKTLKKLKIIIVGSGEEERNLIKMIKKYKLKKIININPWMEFEEFKKLLANSDIFIHPARFDSYGSSSLAMALGAPLIGSKNAGAANERITHEENGFLYDPFNINDLKNYIEILAEDKELREKFSKNGMKKSLEYKPEIIAKRLIKESI